MKLTKELDALKSKPCNLMPSEISLDQRKEFQDVENVKTFVRVKRIILSKIKTYLDNIKTQDKTEVG